MDARTQEQFREQLMELEAELRAALASMQEMAAPVSPDPAIGRLTRMDAMQAQQMTKDLQRRNEARLVQIAAALKRWEHGEFGVCTRCGDEISMARLKVRPEAHLCITCAEGSSRR